MSQSRKQSVLEAIINVLVGYGIGTLSQMFIFPIFGIELPLRSNLIIAALFTVVSLVRSYLIRRLFNRFHK